MRNVNLTLDESRQYSDLIGERYTINRRLTTRNRELRLPTVANPVTDSDRANRASILAHIVTEKGRLSVVNKAIRAFNKTHP